MNQLEKVLLRPIVLTERSSRYVAAIDDLLHDLRQSWDLLHGLPRLPETCEWAKHRLSDEAIRSYAALSEAERARTGDPYLAIQAKALGRDGTAPLAMAAFAWHCSASRFHRDPELLEYFANGLAYFTSCIHDDGVFGATGLNGTTWAHGWDVEGLFYGLVWTQAELNLEVRQKALERLGKSGERFWRLNTMGGHGNQMAVYALGLWLYGQMLDRQEYVAKSDAIWEALLPKILDSSGQVVEQYGPCMHYSFTTLFYGWLNGFLREDEAAMGRVEKCLHWFRARHTDSLYPMPGPSSRMYYEAPGKVTQDLLGACESMATRNPLFGTWAAKLWDSQKGTPPGPGRGQGISQLWGAVAAREISEPSPEQVAAWDEPREQYFENTALMGRSPLKYAQVRRQYQTTVNFCDWLPFSGIQTWALGEEPPIIHPTIFNPSTTRAWGLDTARQGVSHNWARYGAGLMAADRNFRPASALGELTVAVARYDQLWRVMVFTDVTTVIVEWGQYPERISSWTLNRLEPARPEISAGKVSFEGRRACLYALLAGGALNGFPTAQLRLMHSPDGSADSPTLEFDCDGGFAVFALSDNSFQFGIEDLSGEGTLEFSDRAGSYRLKLSPRFFVLGDNGFHDDVFQLAKATIAQRI